MNLMYKTLTKAIFIMCERKNELKKTTCNIDALVIVMSAVEPNFSTQLLDRFLVIAHSYQLNARVLVTKKIKHQLKSSSKLMSC